VTIDEQKWAAPTAYKQVAMMAEEYTQ